MTKVNVQPEGQTNGDQMTQFTELATHKAQTWTFDEKQNHFYIINEGVEDIEVKVAGETRTIKPGENWGEELDYNSFNVRALTDDEEIGNQFSVAATVYGLPGADRINGLLDNIKESNK
ncbi:hypothetical protein [Paenibacillus urinalis]|uniref:hypothetical protein n=1 Tax=Paenibacillus urinalis TaxID=521520 RepID=UPI00195FF0E6